MWLFPAQLFFQIATAIGLLASAMAAAPDAPQPQFAMRQWETDDGLPHNVVNAVALRRDGFLWVATQNGLVRFDGLQFKKLRSSLLADARASSSRTLIDEDARTMLIGSDSSGLVRLTDGAFSLHPLAACIPAGQKVAALFREADNIFWVALSGRTLWRCDHDKVEVFSPPAGVDLYWPVSFALTKAGRVYLARGAGVERYEKGTLERIEATGALPATICASAWGGIWVTTAERLCKFEGDNITIIADPPPWPRDATLNTLAETRDGALWVGTRAQGVLRWHAGVATTVPTSHPRINDLLEDGEDNLWVATAGGGLNRLQPARFALVAEESGLKPDIAGCVCEDAAGDIWFTNRNGVGRLRAGSLEPVPIADAWPKRSIPVCPDHEGNVWIGASPRLLKAKAGTNDFPAVIDAGSIGLIHAIFTARDGAVWVGGETGPLLCFRNGQRTSYGPREGFAGTRIQAIGEDPGGNVWIGCERGDLFQFTRGNFVRYEIKDGLPGSAIRAIHCDAQGTLWVGTGGGGLLVRRGGRFTAINELQGLHDDTVSQILEDDSGALWFGSSRGLSKAQKADLLDCAEGRGPRITPVVFGRSDGLTGFSASGNYQPSAWKTRGGHLYFVTRKGLVKARTDIQAAIPPVLRVAIERLTADSEAVDLARAAVKTSARKLEFQYVAPALSAPERVQYRYQLAGYESGWTDAGTQRTVSYSKLPAGSYQFLVAARNGDLAWNPPAALRVDVRPEWWERWWARAAMAILGAAALVMWIRRWSHRRLKARLAHLEGQRRVEAERTRIARDLHDGLGASLTQAGMLAEELGEDCNDVDAMKNQSAQLANRVRSIARDLDAAVWAVSPKNDSLVSLCSYLCQFALEYFRETATRCRVHTAEDIPDIAMSPEARHHLFLTAKEIMNNTLKHAGAREVELAMEMRDGAFDLTITDDGCGFSVDEAAACDRNGLRNMRARIGEVGGEIDIRSSPSGTTVRISLPGSAIARMRAPAHNGTH